MGPIHDLLNSFDVISIQLKIHLGVLPSEILVISSKVTESSGLLVDRSLKIELLNNSAGSKAEVILDDSL